MKTYWLNQKLYTGDIRSQKSSIQENIRTYKMTPSALPKSTQVTYEYSLNHILLHLVFIKSNRSPAKMTNHGWVKFLFRTWPGCNPHSKTTKPQNTTYWIHTSKRVKYIFPKQDPCIKIVWRTHTVCSDFSPHRLLLSVEETVKLSGQHMTWKHLFFLIFKNIKEIIWYKKQKDTVC